MNNAEIIKGIDLTIEGLTTIKNALLTESAIAPVEALKSKSVERREKVQKEEPMNPPVEEVVESAKEEVVGKFDREQLSSMKFNDLKKLGASLGVKCTGTRDEITERILSIEVTVTADDTMEEPVEEVVEPVAEETPAKSDKPARSKKLGKKEADEPAKDEFDEQAEAIAKETDVEDIIEALADVDIKATKKNAVQKLAEALRKGLIELDEEEEAEDEEVEEEVESEEDGEEITATSYFPEFDPKGYNKPEDMTEERAEAIEAKMDEILTAYSEEELTAEEITSYLEDNATEAELDILGEDYTEEDLLKLYMELVKRTIDNDGEEHEQGEPYEVADKDVCCGHELKYVKKTKKYICEHCGTEYEAE